MRTGKEDRALRELPENVSLKVGITLGQKTSVKVVTLKSLMDGLTPAQLRTVLRRTCKGQLTQALKDKYNYGAYEGKVVDEDLLSVLYSYLNSEYAVD